MLYVPEEKTPTPEYLPQFKVKYFTCYYEADISKFEKLVKSKGGIYEGHLEIDFLNFKNQRVGRQYCCIYQFHEEISMEVLC